jgi:hypothetical protein
VVAGSLQVAAARVQGGTPAEARNRNPEPPETPQYTALIRILLRRGGAPPLSHVPPPRPHLYPCHQRLRNFIKLPLPMGASPALATITVESQKAGRKYHSLIVPHAAKSVIHRDLYGDRDKDAKEGVPLRPKSRLKRSRLNRFDCTHTPSIKLYKAFFWNDNT